MNQSNDNEWGVIDLLLEVVQSSRGKNRVLVWLALNKLVKAGYLESEYPQVKPTQRELSEFKFSSLRLASTSETRQAMVDVYRDHYKLRQVWVDDHDQP